MNYELNIHSTEIIGNINHIPLTFLFTFFIGNFFTFQFEVKFKVLFDSHTEKFKTSKLCIEQIGTRST